MSRTQYRAWCFTLFVEDEKDYSGLLSCEDGIRYAVWQLEMSPTTQRLHLQGYAEFESPTRISKLRQLVGESVHGESRKGTRAQAIAYCKKEESRILGPWDVGSVTSIQQGKRSDLDRVADSIMAGESLHSVIADHPVQYIRYRRGIEALITHRLQERADSWREVTVSIYYGDTGTGKTRKALDENVSRFILDQGDRIWFDGYTGQDTLIIDDFYGWIKFGYLLRVLDGHPLRLEIKGGHTYALWTSVIITSNKPWAEWYSCISETQTAALKRRINHCIHFTNLNGQ